MKILGMFQTQDVPKDDLLELAVLGGQADTVKKVMGDVLQKELQSIMNQFAGAKPDIGTYAFYAGQVSLINKILRSLELQVEDGKEASRQLREGQWQ